jgi:hypothetical protein
MDNIVGFPEHLTEKGRALAGLSPADRDSLLASSAALGIKHDNDPFWIIQGTFTHVKALVVEMRAMAAQTAADSKEAMEAAEATLAETRAVAKKIEPTHESALAHIKATVRGTEAVLTDPASKRIVNSFAGELHTQLKTTGFPAAQIGGVVTSSVALTLAFTFGDVLGASGWHITQLPALISTVGLPGLVIGQVVVIAATVGWVLKIR